MNQPTPKTRNKNLFDQVLEFILKNKWPVTIGAGIVLASALVLVAVMGVSQSNEDKAGQMYDVSQSYINSLRYVTNRTDRERIYQEQINNMNAIIQSYPGTVAATRARLYLGRAFYEEAYTTGKVDSISVAVSYYQSVIESGAADFHKALALIGSAQCSEQKNDYASAFRDYSLVAGKYRRQGFAPLALVGMARAKEMIGDIQNALFHYQQVIRDHPDSLWTRFAQGKIAFYSEPSQRVAAPAANTNVLPFNP
jgi:tetratricopeptide (TPR) repeat protein